MTWEAQIVRASDPATESASFEPLCLGELAKAKAIVDAAFWPNTWIDPWAAVFDGNGFSLQIRIAVRLDALMIEAWGSGNPVPLLVRFAEAHGWAILDTAQWSLLPRGSSTAAGWEAHLARRPEPRHP